MGWGGGGGALSGAQGGGSFADNLVNSALRYRAQAPLVDSLLKEVGLTPSDISHYVEPFTEAETDVGPERPKDGSGG